MTMAVVGGLIPPKEVHLLIFTCEYVALCGKGILQVWLS